MNKDYISVVVESLPTSAYAELLPWVAGIVLPVALFLVSKTFAGKAEKSANEFTIKLHKEERAHLQKLRALDLLNEVFKNTHKLKRISIQRKKSSEIGKLLLESNNNIPVAGNVSLTSLQREYLIPLLSRNRR